MEKERYMEGVRLREFQRIEAMREDPSLDLKVSRSRYAVEVRVEETKRLHSVNPDITPREVAKSIGVDVSTAIGYLRKLGFYEASRTRGLDYTDQNQRNMAWFYRDELLEFQEPNRVSAVFKYPRAIKPLKRYKLVIRTWRPARGAHKGFYYVLTDRARELLGLAS